MASGRIGVTPALDRVDVDMWIIPVVHSVANTATDIL